MLKEQDNQLRGASKPGRLWHVDLSLLKGQGHLKQYLLSMLALIKVLTIAVAFIAIQAGEPITISLAGGVMFSALALDSVIKSKGHLRPSVLVATTFALQFAFANAIAMSSYNRQDEAKYLVYAVPEFFFTASLVGVIGGLAFWSGITLAEQRKAIINTRVSPIHVRLVVAERKSRPAIFIIFLSATLINIFAPINKLGTIGDLIELLPLLTIFLWARLLTLKEWSAWVVLYIMIMVISVHAFLFSFLRINMIMPVVFAVLGLAYTYRWRFLSSTKIIPLAAVLLLFLSIFVVFGNIRDNISVGVERVFVIKERLQSQDDENSFTFIGRMSTINQLTQIVRLTDENGFYNGASLDYLSYVFIPRFMWEEKPLVAKGQWFASEIGQGRWLESGRYSNSINMTIPGELYLNFGWVGMVIGCFLAGIILGLIHRAVAGGGAYDLLGGAILAYLLWVAVTAGADIQIIITLLAIYLLFVAFSFALHVLNSLKRPSLIQRAGYLLPKP